MKPNRKFYMLNKTSTYRTVVSVIRSIVSVYKNLTERRTWMTRNQIAWQNLLETRRSAIANQEEVNRHNRAWEYENQRHNIEGENLTRTANQELMRHNREFESIQRESNRDARTAKWRDYKLASDRLFNDVMQFSSTMKQRRDELEETRRRREADVALQFSQQNERVRANRASEIQRRNELRHKQRVDRFYARQAKVNDTVKNYSTITKMLGDVFRPLSTVAQFFG